MLEEKAHSHTFQIPAFLPAQQHQPWDSWFASCHGFVSRWTWEPVQVLVIWINGNWDSEGQKREEQSFQNQIFPLLLKCFRRDRAPRSLHSVSQRTWVTDHYLSHKLTAKHSMCLVGASREPQGGEGACRGTLHCFPSHFREAPN